MTLLSMSISATIMILVVVIIRNVGKSVVSKNVIMCLWDVIILRALLPIRIPLEKIPFISNLFSEAVNIADIPLKTVADQAINTTAIIETKGPIGIQEIALIVWAVGAAIAIAWTTIVYITKSRILQTCIPVKNKVVARTIKKAGIHRKITLYKNPNLTTAMTFGTIHPKIMLPENIESLPEQDVSNMILHELQHIRMCDIFRRYIMSIAVSVHWFNPAVWLLQKMYMEDQELACDERVICNMKTSGYKSYAATLSLIEEINSAKVNKGIGFKKEKVSVVRIKKVLAYKKMGACGITLSILLFVCSMMTFASYRPLSTMKPNKQLKMEETYTYSKRKDINVPEIDGVVDGDKKEKKIVSSKDVGIENLEESSEDYEEILQDIKDNYNDFSIEPTTQQVEAAHEYVRRELAKEGKEQLDNGYEVAEEILSLVQNYYLGY